MENKAVKGKCGIVKSISRISEDRIEFVLTDMQGEETSFFSGTTNPDQVECLNSKGEIMLRYSDEAEEATGLHEVVYTAYIVAWMGGPAK